MSHARRLIAISGQQRRLVKVRDLASFVGFAQSVELACPAARLYLRSLHDVMATRSSWEGSVRLDRQAIRDLGWWREIGSADVSRTIWRPPTDRTLHCDASRLAWGGVLDGTVPAQGMWQGRERGRHINYLELMSVYLTLMRFLGELQNASVLLWEDNTTVVHVLTNRTTRSPELMHLLRKVWRLLDRAGITLRVRYIASADNTWADALSRGSPFDDLELRARAWAQIESRWGPHSVDRYASAATAQVRRFNSLLPHQGGEAASALTQDWRGENNFVFPPPAELPRIAQLLQERPTIEATVVTPYWPAQAWFQQLAAIADAVETRPLAAIAEAPGWLPDSARHALTGAMLTYFRVAGRRGGSRRAE